MAWVRTRCIEFPPLTDFFITDLVNLLEKKGYYVFVKYSSHERERTRDTMYYELVSAVLSRDILNYFDIVDIEQSYNKFCFHLDEKAREVSNFEFYGFSSPTTVKDVPIRDYEVFLVFRRRRWYDKRTGQSFSYPICIWQAGYNHSLEFQSYLEDISAIGKIPSD